MLNSCPLAEGRYHILPDGKRLRYAIYEPDGPPRGTVLVAPGRREFIEKKHAETGRFFLDRGFRLIHFEWRGQGLSDRFTDEAIRQRDHIPDFTIHMKDLSSFFDTVVKPRLTGPLVLCGHSMGAHLLLRWQMENPGNPAQALIITGTMLALAGHIAHASAHALCWGAIKLGYGHDYGPMQHDYGLEDRAFQGNPLSHDPQRFAIIEKYFDAWPKLTVGGITWQWLDAAIKSMHITQSTLRLERVRLPVLSITGAEDRVTPVSEITRYLKRIPKIRNFVIKGALHDVLNEADPMRAEAFQHIAEFLATLNYA